MSHGHEIVKCSNCEEIIRQCRCMDNNKPISTEICGKCQATPPKEK